MVIVVSDIYCYNNVTLCVFQALFDWVDIAGGKLASMSPIGTDLETVKQQIEELKVWVRAEKSTRHIAFLSS